MADRNPKNSNADLFKSLTRLFSGPIASYRTQNTRRLRRSLLDKYATQFRSASGQQFKRSESYAFTNLQNNIMTNHNRSERYVDFDQMEYTPEIASALDIYADEMTTHSSLEPMLHIKCSNDEIKAVLETLYHSVLNINFNLFGWCRTMCKYGDYFLYLDIDDQRGITNVIGLPINEIERLEGEDKTNPNYVQFQWNSAGMTLENWQMAHFRILGNDKYAPYGTSVLEAARRIWRQLTLLEDAMMAYRIVRAPERRVFYIDVGEIPPNEVEQYMQKVMTQMKRNSVVDDRTGRVDLRYNPLSVEEDYYIPVRGQNKSEISALPGGQFTSAIEDVKYLRDKLFSALKIPASYLTQGDAGSEDKTTLAQKDIRFARTIQRLQRAVLSELEKIGIIHLHTLGFRGEDLTAFKLALNNPSKIAELQELEHWDKKFSVASSATEGFFSRRWMAQHLFNMSEEEFLRNQREIYYDRKYDAQLNAVAEKMQEEAANLLGGASAGNDELDLGEPDLDVGLDTDVPDIGEEPEADAGTEEPDTNLLATPEEGALQEDESSPVIAKRIRAGGVEVKKRAPKSGKVYWHKPKKRAKGDVANQHDIKATVSPESTVGRTARSLVKGRDNLSNLGKGIPESVGTNYSTGIDDVLNAQKEIETLLESLETSMETINETKTQ
jgi:hypothetical protein